MDTRGSQQSFRPRALSATPVHWPRFWKKFLVSMAVGLLLLALPCLMAVLACDLHQQRGPYWLGMNSDPDYVYLMNSLTLLDLGAPGHTDHPGTPLQVLGALVIAVRHVIRGRLDLVTDVITNPEAFLTAINFALVAVCFATLLAVGFIVWRGAGSLAVALLLQTAPFVSIQTMTFLIRVRPELMLQILFAAFSAVVCLLVFRKTGGTVLDPMKTPVRPGTATCRSGAISPSGSGWAAGGSPQTGRREWKFPVLFGILIGLAIATKIVAAPMALIPLLLLEGRRAKAIYGAVAVVALFAGVLPILGAIPGMVRWYFGILTHTGYFGDGARGFPNWTRYWKDARQLVSEDPYAVRVALACVAAGLISLLRKRQATMVEGRLRGAVFAVAAGQGLQFLIVAKCPDSHYLVPSLALAGLNLALILGLIREWAGRKARLASGGFFVAALGLMAGCNWRPLMESRKAFEEQRELQLEVYEAARARPEKIKVFFHRCSQPAFALEFGDRYAHRRFAGRLRALYPETLVYGVWQDDYHRFDQWDYIPEMHARNPGRVFHFDGNADLAEILAKNPGRVLFQGTTPRGRNRLPEDLELLTGNSIEGLFLLRGLEKQRVAWR